MRSSDQVQRHAPGAPDCAIASLPTTYKDTTVGVYFLVDRLISLAGGNKWKSCHNKLTLAVPKP